MEKKQNKFIGFFKKKRTKKELIYDLILLVSICVFVFSAFVLIKYFYEIQSNKNAYEEINNELVVTDEEGNEVWVWDYSKMAEKYPDIKGWIKLGSGEYINYPILQGSDNAYYLDHNAAGEYNGGGAIFMDYRNDMGLEDMNCIIYGHNMRVGTMFGSLKYFEDTSYYQANKNFDIYIEDKHYRYEVFAVYYTSASDLDTYRYDFANADDYFQYLVSSRSKSIIQTDFRELTTEDKILTLSTCTKNDRTQRMIVQLVRCEEIVD